MALLLGSLAALAFGVIALTPHASVRASWTGVRVGIASLVVAVALVLAVALGPGLEDGMNWLVLDGVIVLSGVAAVTLGFAVLRRLLPARPTSVRGQRSAPGSASRSRC